MIKLPLFCLLLIIAHTGRCGSVGPGDSLTIEKAVRRYNISAPRISPDGSRAVVSVTPGLGLPDSLVSHLWILDIRSKEFRQFTSSARSETNPRWSPDGQQLAFLSARNGTTQIFLIRMDGGEALPLTHSKTGIQTFDWAPDGRSIIYVTEEELSDSLKKRRGQKFDEIAVGENDQPACIYRIDLGTREARLLTRQNWDIHEMKWIPSKKEILLVCSPSPEEEIPVRDLIAFNPSDSTFTHLGSTKDPFFSNIVLSPDGKTAAYSGARADGPIAHDLFIHHLDSNSYKNISEKTLDRIVVSYKFRDSHTLLGLVQSGFENRLYVIKDDGTVTPYPLKENMQSFDLAPDGTLVYVKGSFTELPEVYMARPGSQPEKVSAINPSFASFSLVTPKLFTYKSWDGRLVEAALFLPTGGQAHPKFPMITYIHGGPTGAHSNAYNPWVQLLVQSGYAVFCPNIRGSTGYGQDFMALNRKDWGGNDYKDMMAGIDHLIKTEPIDPERLGISGWSYGGYMAEWAITQTHRFKASVCGAGISNLASEFGTEGGVSYDRWFWGVPYENIELFMHHSPIAYLDQVTTPTLIIQGEEDATDPEGQSLELYRGLHYYHVPCQLVLYPREPHGFKEPNHYIDFYRRMLLWFKKYL